ncbi:MAG: TIGR02757 family protein [Actinobacteria bacterium]|nr:TIGR02757 family protein [Actinomycetota bacterium]
MTAYNIDKKTLDDLYYKYNKREFVHPDPLEFLYDYKSSSEREVVGIIAASIAYGQVRQILKSVSFILQRLGSKPSEFLKSADSSLLQNTFKDFKHRFTTGAELSLFLENVGRVLKKYGSLNECFLWGFKKEKEILPAIMHFAKELRQGECECYNSLVPMPAGKCAYKRINLYLRWMIRKDNVDPGCWNNIPAKHLIVPLDIHMHRVSSLYGFTERKQADFNTALQITEAFKKFDPEDPVKYDFALTRAGILSARCNQGI